MFRKYLAKIVFTIFFFIVAGFIYLSWTIPKKAEVNLKKVMNTYNIQADFDTAYATEFFEGDELFVLQNFNSCDSFYVIWEFPIQNIIIKDVQVSKEKTERVVKLSSKHAIGVPLGGTDLMVMGRSRFKVKGDLTFYFDNESFDIEKENNNIIGFHNLNYDFCLYSNDRFISSIGFYKNEYFYHLEKRNYSGREFLLIEVV